jgi:hypothetical protein
MHTFPDILSAGFQKKEAGYVTQHTVAFVFCVEGNCTGRSCDSKIN